MVSPNRTPVILGGYPCPQHVPIEERIARRLMIPAFAETKVVAVQQTPRSSAALFWRPGRLLLRPAVTDSTSHLISIGSQEASSWAVITTAAAVHGR